MEENKMEAEQKNTEQVADEQKATTGQTPAENAAEQAPEDAKADEGTATEQPAAEESKTEEKPAEEKPAEPDWRDRCARLMADYDNYRKRMARDREDLVKSAAKDVVKDVLSTVDNLARALEGAKDKTDDPFVQGVKLVYDGLLKTLADHGATPLDSVGEPFDANFHEAVAQFPSPEVAEGVVMAETLRGWLLHGKLLRAAKVVVSSGKGA